MARVDNALDLALNHPRSGRRTDKGDLRRLVVPPYPYAIFYRVDGEDVVVLAIRHTARRPIP